jgi:hypothetical protein
MALFNINKAASTDYENNIDSVTIANKSTDGPTGNGETYWTNKDFSKWWGYFTEIGDVQSALLMKAIWDVGKGFTCDPETQVVLDQITGTGKDTFLDILFNLDVVRYINGDSYAEIVRDEEGNLLNIKPLDPSSIKVIFDEKGMVKAYEQFSKFPQKGFVNAIKNTLRIRKIVEFKTTEMLHLQNSRLVDQMHGLSKIAAMEKTILADNENFDDMKKLMHRQVKPFMIFKLKTDKETEINAFIEKLERVRNKTEDLIIPDDENIVSWEVVQVNLPAAIFEWRSDIRNKFYRIAGMPLIIFGSGGSTESGGKMEYLSHEQVFNHEQTYIERQIWNQLGIRINLVPPTSLLENLQTDEQKDANQGLEIQKSDVTAGRGK